MRRITALLQDKRNKHGLTQGEAAQVLGISRFTYTNWEHAKVAWETAGFIVRLRDHLGLTSDEVLALVTEDHEYTIEELSAWLEDTTYPQYRFGHMTKPKPPLRAPFRPKPQPSQQRAESETIDLLSPD